MDDATLLKIPLSMIKLLQLLIFGHVHKWKIITEGHLADSNSVVVGNYYDLQCEHCGNIKRKNVSGDD